MAPALLCFWWSWCHPQESSCPCPAGQLWTFGCSRQNWIYWRESTKHTHLFAFTSTLAPSGVVSTMHWHHSHINIISKQILENLLFLKHILSSLLSFKAGLNSQVTSVSDTAFSSFFRFSWEEELAEALSSWCLIFTNSSSNRSRSCSNVWAQLSHSGRQNRTSLAKYYIPFILCQFFLVIYLGIAHQCLCLLAPVCSCKLQHSHRKILYIYFV